MSKLRIFLLLLLSLPVVSSAQELNRIVAVINNDVVTSLQLEKAVAQNGNGALDERRQILERLIEESLIKQRAEEIGLSATDEEVESAVQDILRQNRLTKEQLDIALTQQGLSPAEYRQNLRRQILRFKLVGREVQGMMEVSSREIQDYYQSHEDEFRQGETLDLKHIVFPLSAENSAAQRSRGEDALQSLRAGKDFESVLAGARQGGADGGEMNGLSPGDLTPEFAAAIKDLPVGSCSELVVSDAALHLLVVSARTPGKIRPLEEVRDGIRSKLADQKRSTAATDWIEGLKKRAHIDNRL